MAMIEPDDIGAARSRRSLKLIVLGSVAGGLVAFGSGLILAGLHNGAWTPRLLLMLGAVAAVAVACLWLLVRTLRTPTGEAPLTAKERLNRNLYLGAVLIGVAGAVLLIVGTHGTPRADLLSNAPLPAGLALAMVLLSGVIVPALTLYWYRNAIDEVEANGYRTASTWALHVFLVAAPLWWFAWRGGFAPEPDGVLIYFVTVVVMGAVALWKKYR